MTRPASTVRAARAVPERARVDLELPTCAPIDAPGLFAWLAARAVDGVELVESDPARLRYARTLPLPGGPAVVDVRATATAPHAWRFTAHLDLADAADVGAATTRLRRLFDLDADPVAADAALRSDPALAPSVARTPGIRLPGAVDADEYVVRAIVGQQISVAAARQHLSRFAAAIGEPIETAIPGLDRLFPTAARIAALPDPPATGPLDPERPLRLPRRQIATVLRAARAIAAGELRLADRPPAALRAALTAIPGIGPWTSEYLAMRLTGDRDAWPVGDVALLAGARALGLLPIEPSASDHRVLAARAADWAPWRSSAALHLWRAASRPKGDS